MASGQASAAEPGSCDPARPHATGDFDETIISGGLTREYILHIPPSYTGTEAVPLVFNWHGLDSNAERQAAFSELPAKADAEGFIVVMPRGVSTTGVSLNHWNIPLASPDTGEADDVGFVADLLDALESELCVDDGRIYAAGMSNGAQMSVRAGCSFSDRIAAIAPVAGAYYPPFTPGFPEEPGCVSTRPAALIAFHGTADTLIPFAGGPGNLGVIFRPFEDEIMPDWAEHNGCTVGPVHKPVTAHWRSGLYPVSPKSRSPNDRLN